MMLLDTPLDPLNSFWPIFFSLRGLLIYKINQAATKVKSGGCLIDQAAARLKSGSHMIDQTLVCEKFMRWNVSC